MAFSGNPYVFTTYDRAVEYAPSTRKTLSCVLAAPRPGCSAEQVARQITKMTGLKAYTQKQFFWVTVWWYIRNTGIPVAFGATVILGFVVGLVVSSQTFYSFVLENLKHLGALKAMGASDGRLTAMLLLQSLTVGIIGYGCGVGLSTLFGIIVIKKEMPPFHMPWQLPVGVFVVVMFICAMAAALGIRKLNKLEPAVVFRG
jgi:putative ABC transport system permease protein